MVRMISDRSLLTGLRAMSSAVMMDVPRAWRASSSAVPSTRTSDSVAAVSGVVVVWAKARLWAARATADSAKRRIFWEEDGMVCKICIEINSHYHSI